jgi:hypothetical protein
MKIARLVLSATAFAICLATAQAAPVDSVESASAKPALQKIDSFLSDKIVVEQLTKLGVTAEQAQARVAKLNDAQLTQLAAQVDQLRAGGDIVPGMVQPLGPLGCVLKRIGDSIVHVIRFLFCWNDIQ